MKKDTIESNLDILRDLINKSNDAIFVADPQTGLFIFVNDKACTSLGYDRQELLAMGVMDIEATFADKSSWQIHINEVRQRRGLILEGIHRRKNGTTFPVEINVSYVVRKSGEYVVAVVRDITERKWAEEEISERMWMEDRLRGSEEKYRLLVEAANSVILTWDTLGRITFLNDFSERFFGFSKEELLGRNVVGTIVPLSETTGRDLGRLMEEIRKDPGRFEENENENMTKDGRRVWVRWANKAIVDEHGTLMGILSVGNDITERKRAEEEKDRLAKAVSVVTEGIAMTDEKDGFIYVNDAHAKIYGYLPGQLIGKTWRDLMPRELVPLVERELSGTLHNRDKGTWSGECSSLRKDGTVIPTEVTATARWSDKGEYLGHICVVKDITERKLAEEALQLTRFTVDNVVDAVYWVDSKARVVDVNETACKMLGYTREELLNLTVLDIDPGFTADRWARAWETVKEIGKFTIETIHRLKDGRLIPVEIMVNYLVFGGKELHCAFARDISQRKLVEKELMKTQKLESLGILAGGIAHDFNNLLQAMMGNISLAKTLTNPGEKIFPLLEEAEKASEQAKELSYRLLTFSKGGDPVKRIVSLESVLKESISLCLSGSNVACELRLPKELDLVEADKGQMNQVFNNLLINAKEAMSYGGTIEVRAVNVKVTGRDNLPLKEGNYVKVSLADHGAGIPEKYLPRIFDPYFSTKDRGSEKGTGLGLAICYSIVAKHEGYIAVESRMGVGTVFHIYLPAAERKHEEGPGRESRSAQGKGRVLFMDDDERVRKITGAMLEHLGYEVEFAKNGEEAIEAYRRAQEGGRTFDAAILDLTVQGGMGGEKAVRRLREMDPEVSAVVSSGYADDPVMKEFGRYGFVDALAKPYNAEALKRLLVKLQP